MEASAPVYCDSCIATQKYLSRIDRTPTRQLAKLVKTCKSRAVPSLIHGKLAFEFIGVYIEPPFFFSFEHHFVVVLESVAGEYVLADKVLEVVDVLRVVKAQEFFPVRSPGPIDIELSIEIEGLYKGVSHGNTSRFHGVILVVVEFADLLVVEVSHVPPKLHRLDYILA